MWIMLNNAFFSIVTDHDPDRLLVRARRPGDIPKVFSVPETYTPMRDYPYRASVARGHVAAMIGDALESIEYDNFKASVSDQRLQSAYTRVWETMIQVEANPA